MANEIRYIFLIIILFLCNFNFLFGQNQYDKSWKFVKSLTEQNRYCDFKSKEIIDSSIIDIDPKPVLLVYCKDTLGKINGNVYICDKNGYYFYGNYTKRPKRWNLDIIQMYS
jgi:hypothetical protein